MKFLFVLVLLVCTNLFFCQRGNATTGSPGCGSTSKCEPTNIHIHCSAQEKTQKEMSEELAKMLRNHSEMIRKELEDIKSKYDQMKAEIANISKKEGPMGPPGYNGTRGSPGASGPPGLPGLNGTQGLPGTSPTGGDLTLCSYQEKKGTEVNTGSYASTLVSVNEANGKKIIGANCVSNDAKIVLLSSSTSGGTRKYQCDCSNTLNTGVSKMYCSIHYWEC
ncbi:macrophage scavenger receptor types I and II-like isoform X2 [Acropora millepora]|uniref:macrophage scavenger receptor types I and II-like isoform X2 n=1 Tax=Acropora millepora TaxID=45264 RepID=UPI001CF4EA6F|nr:macrophage scavenger receptor types I and II-like isoform X2 [Acropora millepora]